jgi:hypothetical protein
MDNNINNFNKDIVSTTTSGNFFYNNYSVKHFITLNRLILIETAKNIVTSINNNAFIYSLTSSIEPSSIEPSSTKPGIVRSNNKGKSTTYFCNNNNNNNNVNIENLTINIDFLNYYFNNNG